KERKTTSQSGPVRHVCACTVIAKANDINRHSPSFLVKKVSKRFSGLCMPSSLKGEMSHGLKSDGGRECKSTVRVVQPLWLLMSLSQATGTLGCGHRVGHVWPSG